MRKIYVCIVVIEHERNTMLDRHIKKASLSPDDKQDIIASERARRRIIAENESASRLT